ncbi:MAG: hypothetical protein LAP39_28140 [Acidobacteriia bacterium]|nr:hypothetical protein [Terriglobia bacterium]
MSIPAAEAATPEESCVPEPAAPRQGGKDFWARTPVRAGLVSLLLLVPCFWQTHIQAVDLSSHLYNAWLSILIGQGKAPGLAIAPQRTNVLFDLILAGLMRAVGPWGAEHIAVPLAVLVFFWGAFAMICTVSRRRPWYLLSIIAMLAYGWTYHMGFMNFYLSLGLSFCAFALLWRHEWKFKLGALPLVALAYVAHALPVAWLAGAMAYTGLARRMRPRARPILVFAAVALLAILRQFLMAHFPTRWEQTQFLSMTGADQMSVFESKYHPLEFILLAIWVSLFLRLVKLKSGGRVLFGIPFQLCVIVGAAVLFLPGAILLPGYNHALRYISERMSLIVGVAGCALLGRVSPGKREKAAIAVLMGLFFSFLYVDTRSLNYVESLMEQSVAQLPPGSRVISALCDQRRDVNLLGHTLDRVCIRRCFSYANYEPSSGAFRVRVVGPNPIVVAEDRDSNALQEGRYVVKPGDVPLYQIYLRGRYLDTRLLQAGDVNGATCFESTPSPGNLLGERSNAHH